MSWCPICNKKVATANLEKHVNECLDDNLARTIGVEEGDLPVERPDDDNEDDDGVGGAATVGSNSSATPKRPRTSANTKTSVVCGICNEFIDADEMFIADECDHKFCNGCVKKQVLHRVANDVKIGCPSKDCKTILSIRDVKHLLPKKALIAPTGSSHVASSRLMAELQHINDSNSEKNGYSVEPIDDNLYEWEIRLFNFDKSDGPIFDDLSKTKDKAIIMKAVFKADYPFSPPFIRVIRPRFQYRTGHVTLGGSICTELLTQSGWSAFNTLESVIVSVRANLVLGGARLMAGRQADYTEAEAKEAFDRTVREHGW